SLSRISFGVLVSTLLLACPAVAYSMAEAEKPYAGELYDDAFKMFQSLAANGSEEAEVRMADMLSSGRGVAKESDKALQIYRQAAARGDPRAETGLGAMYYLGNGVPKDFSQAVHWFRLAIAQDEDRAEL